MIELAEAIVVPTIAELGALRALRTMVDYLNDTGSAVTKSVFVLNNIYPKEPLRTSDVESALGSKFALELPYDPHALREGRQRGRPPHHRLTQVGRRRPDVATGRTGARRRQRNADDNGTPAGSGRPAPPTRLSFGASGLHGLD